MATSCMAASTSARMFSSVHHAPAIITQHIPCTLSFKPTQSSSRVWRRTLWHATEQLLTHQPTAVHIMTSHITHHTLTMHHTNICFMVTSSDLLLIHHLSACCRCAVPLTGCVMTVMAWLCAPMHASAPWTCQRPGTWGITGRTRCHTSSHKAGTCLAMACMLLGRTSLQHEAAC